MKMSTIRLGIVLLASAQLVAAAPSVSERLSTVCLEKSSNSAEACYCLGDLAENSLGMREQKIILARKEGRENAARGLMKGLDFGSAIQLVKDLKNFKEAARRDCRVSLRMK